MCSAGPVGALYVVVVLVLGTSSEARKPLLLLESVLTYIPLTFPTLAGIEAKMFYGASTIPSDGKSAVGTLLATAQKYVRFHGPGAMVFMQGFGDRLADQLLELGVLPLDCSATASTTVSLQQVEQHQRTWCANTDGIILP